MTTSKVNWILSAAAALAFVGCALTGNTVEAGVQEDHDHLISVLKSSSMKPEDKFLELYGYENQDLVLDFASLGEQHTVREYAGMCQPAVAQCNTGHFKGLYDPVPARVYPAMKEYAHYCHTKLRLYCRENFDRMARYLMFGTFTQEERLLLTALFRYYKEAKAGDGKVSAKRVGTEEMSDVQKKIIDAYIELLKSRFGDRGVLAREEMEFLDKVATILTEFGKIFELFNMLTEEGEPRLESQEQTDMLIEEWWTVGELVEGFANGVYNYFYPQIKSRMKNEGILDHILNRRTPIASLYKNTD